jgi:alkyl sulfatase BDS1-like metallo-beta-lactamase superfamily hydrolase
MGHGLVRLQADHGASRQCGVNHFGGDCGVVSENDVKIGKMQILSPIEFLKHPDS